ncbi:MAG: hypothetical protein JWM80_1513 [Cyanobacteria bacterium RYN_339]|nr:hypothetical protein [Cyanobacteria bacterium RYN_339]
MKARTGFTLLELLIAAGLGMGIVAIAIQQLFEFFRLQAVLMARTELREELQLAQERIGSKLRYAIMLEDVPNNEGFMAVVPNDLDRCGYICALDSYEVLWWHVVKNPLKPENAVLMEQSYTMAAFRDEPDMKVLTNLFKTHTVTTRVIAPTMEKLQINVEPPKTFRTMLLASRPIPRRPEPVKIGLTELIAPRSLPFADGATPSFADVMEKLKKEEGSR